MTHWMHPRQAEAIAALAPARWTPIPESGA